MERISGILPLRVERGTPVLRPRGLYSPNETYVYNEQFRDYVTIQEAVIIDETTALLKDFYFLVRNRWDAIKGVRPIPNDDNPNSRWEQTTKIEFGDTQIGGVNILLDTKIGYSFAETDYPNSSDLTTVINSDGFREVTISTNKNTAYIGEDTVLTTAYRYAKPRFSFFPQTEKDYVFSFDYKTNNAESLIHIDLRSSSSDALKFSTVLPGTKGVWKRGHILCNWKITTQKFIFVMIRMLSVEAGYYLSIRKMMLEEGNTLTNYKEAEEDIDSRIKIVRDVATALEAKVGDISQNVLEVQESVGEVQNSVSIVQEDYAQKTNTINNKELGTNPILNGADIKLTGYNKPENGLLSATDMINLAMNKLDAALSSLKKFAENLVIHYDYYDDFRNALNAGEIPINSIVFIKEKRIIYSAGEYYLSSNGTIPAEGLNYNVIGTADGGNNFKRLNERLTVYFNTTLAMRLDAGMYIILEITNNYNTSVTINFSDFAVNFNPVLFNNINSISLYDGEIDGIISSNPGIETNNTGINIPSEKTARIGIFFVRTIGDSEAKPSGNYSLTTNILYKNNLIWNGSLLINAITI